ASTGNAQNCIAAARRCSLPITCPSSPISGCFERAKSEQKRLTQTTKKCHRLRSKTDQPTSAPRCQLFRFSPGAYIALIPRRSLEKHADCGRCNRVMSFL